MGLLALLAAGGCTRLKDNGFAPLDGPPCRHATPPGPPGVAADVPGQLDLVFATGPADFGDEDDATDARTIGYDLDDTCTGQGEGESCAEPSWAGIQHPDGLDGRDNGIAVAFGAIAPGLPWLTYIFGARSSGMQATIIRVRDYDGMPDDSHVEVDVYSGTLWNSETDVTGPAPEGNEHDRWKIGSDWLEPPAVPDGALDPARSRYRDADAYVAGGVLVARMPTLLMGDAFLPAGELHGALLTGELVSTKDGWAIKRGILAGKWNISDLLRIMSFYTDLTTHESLCADSASFKRARSQFCPFVDVRVAGTDPSLPCDGMSMAYRFTAVPASLGTIVAKEPSPQTCTQENDPATHGCGVP